jgi:hypothetical protein
MHNSRYDGTALAEIIEDRLIAGYPGRVTGA